MEIERKFLLGLLPTHMSFTSKRNIKQGYLATIKNGVEIRLRKYGRSYYQTIKSSGLLQRAEREIKLTKHQFETLWPFTEGKRLEKIRYTYCFDNLILEVDIYLKDLKGLKIAEIEFPSVQDSLNFTPPEWFGKEVTNDTKFKNRNLAG